MDKDKRSPFAAYHDSTHIEGQATIKQMRKALGLPPIREDWAVCKECEDKFVTDFKFDRPIQRFCGRCRYSMTDPFPDYRIPGK